MRHHDKETYDHAADLMVEVAGTKGHPEHADDAGEIEHLREQSKIVRVGNMEPPDWALAIIFPRGERPRTYTADEIDAMREGAWDERHGLPGGIAAR
jgi:hypothetical protein